MPHLAARTADTLSLAPLGVSSSIRTTTLDLGDCIELVLASHATEMRSEGTR